MQHKKLAQQKRCQFGLALSLQKHPYCCRSKVHNSTQIHTYIYIIWTKCYSNSMANLYAHRRFTPKKCDQTINSFSNHQGLAFSMSQLTNLGGTLGTQNFHATTKLDHVPSENVVKNGMKMPYVSQIPIPTSTSWGISRLQFLLRATPLVGHQDIFQLHIPVDDALTCETNGGYHGLHH